jgi:hypothetical protein
MKLEGFNTIDFGTSREGVVYVFFVATETEEIPFYVGETDRFQGRMDDYVRAQFAAPTDFKVGEAEGRKDHLEWTPILRQPVKP